MKEEIFEILFVTRLGFRTTSMVRIFYYAFEEAIEPLDEFVDFQFQWIGTHHCAVDSRVERGCVTAFGEDPNAFHLCTVKVHARFFQHGVNCNGQFTNGDSQHWWKYALPVPFVRIGHGCTMRR